MAALVIPAPSARGVNLAIGVLALFALTVLANLMLTRALIARGAPSQPPVVQIDAPGMMLGFLASRPPGLAGADLQREVLAFNASVDAELAAYAAARGVILVNSTAVVSGAPDVTADVLAHMGLVPAGQPAPDARSLAALSEAQE